MEKKNKNHEILCKHLDIHTIAKINGENVLITMPYMIGKPGEDWEGHLLFTKEFLADVVASACHNEVTAWEDFKLCVEQKLESLKEIADIANKN